MPGTISRPLVAADNYLDPYVLNRSHTLTTPAGSGVLSGSLRALWDGRRGSRSTVTIARDGSNNADLVVDCGTAKGAGLLWIGTGHNFAGAGRIARVSSSINGTAWTERASGLVNSTGGNGKLLDDGAWALSFTEASERYWRLRIESATSNPVFSLVFLGKALYLGNYMTDSARDDSREVGYPARTRSRRGVVSLGEQPVVARFVRGHYRTTLNEYDGGLSAWTAAWFDKGMPTLWCTDWQNQPGRMRLYVNNGSVLDPQWRVQGFREFDIDLIEAL